ncbi:MAG: hypothetical protein IPN01_09405 [Deltaproteobacteria bacterium]|nr:hypothetical protein [Deltaproteobacteria bacterium]
MAHDTRAEGASEPALALSAALSEARAALSVLELAPRAPPRRGGRAP